MPSETENVPDELLLAALSASTGKTLADLYDLIEVDGDDHAAMERALRAVLPLHEQAVREQVASEFEADADAVEENSAPHPATAAHVSTLRAAARTARGETRG